MLDVRHLHRHVDRHALSSCHWVWSIVDKGHLLLSHLSRHGHKLRLLRSLVKVLAALGSSHLVLLLDLVLLTAWLTTLVVVVTAVVHVVVVVVSHLILRISTLVASLPWLLLMGLHGHLSGIEAHLGTGLHTSHRGHESISCIWCECA